MKRILTLAFCMIICLSATMLRAQDTLAAWTFPASSADSLADVSIPLNSARYISCQYGTWGAPTYHGITTIYSINGAGSGADKCAAAAGWNGGADSVYWMVKFKTTGYQNLTLSSRQSSDTTLHGPRDFKIQYKLPGSGNAWTDLAGGILSCTGDWTGAVVTQLPLPADCDNQSGQVSIRWLQISDTSIYGGIVAANGISMIDDIVIAGEPVSGTGMNVTRPLMKIFPNPCNGSFYLENAAAGSRAAIYDIRGNLIYLQQLSPGALVCPESVAPGMYIVRVAGPGDDKKDFRLIVE